MNKTIAVIEDFMDVRHHVQIETAVSSFGYQVRWLLT